MAVSATLISMLCQSTKKKHSRCYEAPLRSTTCRGRNKCNGNSNNTSVVFCVQDSFGLVRGQGQPATNTGKAPINNPASAPNLDPISCLLQQPYPGPQPHPRLTPRTPPLTYLKYHHCRRVDLRRVWRVHAILRAPPTGKLQLPSFRHFRGVGGNIPKADFIFPTASFTSCTALLWSLLPTTKARTCADANNSRRRYVANSGKVRASTWGRMSRTWGSPGMEVLRKLANSRPRETGRAYCTLR